MISRWGGQTWLECDGSEVNATTYPTLANRLSTPYALGATKMIRFTSTKSIGLKKYSYLNGYYIFTCFASNYIFILYSTDLVNWNQSVIQYNAQTDVKVTAISPMRYIDNQYVFVATNTSTGVHTSIYSSASLDGEWTENRIFESGCYDILDFLHHNNKYAIFYVSTKYGVYCLYSTSLSGEYTSKQVTGTTTEDRSRYVLFDGTNFCVFVGDSAPYIYYSTDLTTWNNFSVGFDRFLGTSVSSNGIFIFYYANNSYVITAYSNYMSAYLYNNTLSADGWTGGYCYNVDDIKYVDGKYYAYTLTDGKYIVSVCENLNNGFIEQYRKDMASNFTSGTFFAYNSDKKQMNLVRQMTNYSITDGLTITLICVLGNPTLPRNSVSPANMYIRAQ